MSDIKNLAIKVEPNDVWLMFESNGRHAAISIAALAERHAEGTLIRAALLDWARDRIREEPPR